MGNKNGYCPHCKADMDGDLVINYPLSKGETYEEALKYAKSYEGWEQYGVENRWGRQILIYDVRLDRTVRQRCPDCQGEW